MTARINHEFSSNWHFVVGILNQDATRNINTPVNKLNSIAGNYTSSFANGFAPRFAIVSDTAYLNGSFETWGMGHHLTIGTAGYKARSFSVITPASAASVRLGSASGALTLVTNCVMAWNTRWLQRAVDREAERTAPRYCIDALKCIGPVGHPHINFRGTFRFPVDRYAERLVASVA
jgi:Tn3 transposase DDE domain